MANMNVVEFSHYGLSIRGQSERLGAPLPRLPALKAKTYAYGAAAQSDALLDGVAFVRLTPDAACHVAYGANPTATANDMYVPAGVSVDLAVQAGQKFSFYDGTS